MHTHTSIFALACLGTGKSLTFVMRHSQPLRGFPIASVVIRLIALLLVFCASLLSMSLFMANADDDRVGWVAMMWLLFGACGFVVGACLRRWWFVAIGLAWLPLLLLPEYLGYIEHQGATPEMVMFVLSPVAPLIGAYVGFYVSWEWRAPVNASDAP